MNPIPVRFTDRWGNDTRPSYADAVCWHVLLGADPGVRALAESAQQHLERFGELHMTPPQWLHMTLLRAGDAATLTSPDMNEMLTRARAWLARMRPVTVTFSRVFYHPEAIALTATPADALDEVRAAVNAAASAVAGATPIDEDPRFPHLTLCYSTGEQSTAPVVAELGTGVPPCEVTIRDVSLVVQQGPEQLWDWRVAGSARLGEPGLPRYAGG